MLIQDSGLEVPKVGTVEEFQGQERDVILISTVRSKDSELRNDLIYGLGFLSSDKRMNVAISRARALTVIFGCRAILTEDKNWEFLIKRAIQNNTYCGSDEMYKDEMYKDDIV